MFTSDDATFYLFAFRTPLGGWIPPADDKPETPADPPEKPDEPRKEKKKKKGGAIGLPDYFFATLSGSISL